MIDYYGIDTRTIDDDECENLMNIIVNSREFDTMMTEDDRIFLIDYSSKLFNTTKNPKNIENDIYKLVKLVYEYKQNSSETYGVNVIRENYPKTFKKDQSRKEPALIKHTETILEIMGGDLFHTEQGYELKKLLKDVVNNPTKYIPKKPTKPQTDKTSIKKYLFSLKLKNKTATIESFCDTLL